MLLALPLGAALLAAAPPAPVEAGGSCCTARPGYACPAPTSAVGRYHAFHGPDQEPMPDFESEEAWQAYLLGKLGNPSPHVEPPDPDPFLFSLYKGHRPERMGPQTMINGAKMEVAFLIVDDPPQVVEGEYLRRYQALGAATLRGELPGTRGVRYISFRPPNSQNLKTLTLVPHGPGTVILASVGDPSKMLEEKLNLPEDFPVPEGAEPTASIRSSEEGVQHQSETFVVHGASVDEVRMFYRKALEARGFSPSFSRPDNDSYEQGSSFVSITTQAAGEPEAVLVSVTWIQ